MSIQPIISAMKQVNELHMKLLEAGREKHRAIINNDTTELTKWMMGETRLLKHINEAEELRVEAMKAYLKEKGIRSQLNLTVAELARLVFDPDEKHELLEIRDQLLNNASELHKQNQLTQQLLDQSLSFIDFSLNLYVGVDDDLIYQNPTSVPAKPNKNNFFDAKA
ncbi:flagellar protein FlgN [Paenibacillus rhizolycopersici]|uniref:flagellar protein FlgN n=1 Tax=Paenibacillus rhizolycopersici TaxID=2780073 RepID=UPI003D289B33